MGSTKKPVAIIVTGSREWTRVRRLERAIEDASPDVLIHGGCPTGADKMASMWASRIDENIGVAEVPMGAQWKKHGKSAGPRRNVKMLKVLQALESCGYSCRVLAFPKGKSPGTRGMMKLAKDRGFKVIDCGI